MSAQFDRAADTEPTDATAAPTHPATGIALREARLRRGLAVAEVAADTRINPAYLDAMEAERWELLPAPVYARGFLRSYARYLRFDDEAIERMVPRHLPRPRDLEPAAGLRRSASQPALELPTFGWLRREARMPVADRERRPPAARSPRPTPSTRPPTFARASSGRGAGAAATRVATTVATLLRGSGSAARQLVGQVPWTPQLMLTAAGAALIAAVAGGYLWLGGATTTSAVPRATAVAGAPTPRQAAGPEPVGSAVAPPTVAPVVAPPRDGEMPDLVGRPRQDAEDELGRLELAFVVIEVTTPAAPPGTVYNQSPQPGKEIRRGDSVTLLVARAP